MDKPKILGSIRNSVIPDEKSTFREKSANDFELIKDFIRYYVNNASFDDLSAERRLAKGKIEPSDYDSLLKPFKKKKLNRFYGDIHNVPLIKPILRLLTGEKRRSPFNYVTKVNNSDSKNVYTRELEEYVTKEVDKLAASFFSGDDPKALNNQQQGDLQQKVSKFKANWKDQRAIAGQIILDDIVDTKEVKEYVNSIYKYDWLQTGRAFSMVDVNHNEVDFINLNPEDVWFLPSGKSPKVEDSKAAVVRLRWNLSDIVDRFYEEMNETRVNNRKLIDIFSDIFSYKSAINISGRNGIVQNLKSESDLKKQIEDTFNGLGSNWRNLLSGDYIEFYYVVFKILNPYKILTYYDELGQIQEKEVDGEYKVDKSIGDIKTETIYINQVWKGFYFPAGSTYDPSGTTSIKKDNNDVFLEVGESELQFNELNNNSKCKLNIVGRVDGISIPREIEEFQYLYNIIHHIEKVTLAKEGGKPILFPIDLVPKELSWGNTPDERLETMMWYGHTFNYIFFDGSSDRSASLTQALKAVDMSTIQAVSQFIELKRLIKDEAWATIGMNRNRWGDTYASEGKAKNEQDIFRSSMHTADLNILFNRFEESLLTTALEASKVAYINGKEVVRNPERSDFLVSDEVDAVFSVDPFAHLESQYGVTVASLEDVNEELERIKALGQPYAQNVGNGVPPDVVANMMRTKNPSKAVMYLKQAFEIQQSFVQQQQEAARKSEEKQAELESQKDLKAEEIKIMLKEMESAIKKYVVDTQEETKRMEMGQDDITPSIDNKNEGLDNQKFNLEQQKFNHQRNKENQELGLKQRELNIKQKQLNKQPKNN